MHPLKAVRKAIVALLSDSVIVVDGATVGVLDSPPEQGQVPEESLPALYCFARSEHVSIGTHTSDERGVLVDIVIQAKGFRVNVVDQVDDIHLELERRIAASGRLSGLVASIAPQGSEIHIDRGEVIFAARRVTFEVKMFTSRMDPSV
ncbi:MAG: hypothetical protein ABJO67_03430 [Pseudoruegeria sp.]